jgi:hypothetical protein
MVAALVTARPARAAYLEDAGWGALTVLSNIVYMPAKLVYATLGGVTGGLALGLTGGDMETAETVWVTTMGGTYVITPNMLRGEESIAFAGTPSSGTTDSMEETDTANFQEQPLGGS